MSSEIQKFNNAQKAEDKKICDLLFQVINKHLPDAESKIWHRHPVWFLEGNPIVGYSKQKAGVRLMFWSGMGFAEEGLKPGTGKFKDASIFYTSVDQVVKDDLKRWLEKSQNIQWDYGNISKRKGILVRLK